jgi:hypothetical protein
MLDQRHPVIQRIAVHPTPLRRRSTA